MPLPIFSCVMLGIILSSLGINGDNTNIHVNNSLIVNLVQKSREILKSEDSTRLEDEQTNIPCPKEDNENNNFQLSLLNGSASGLTDYVVGQNVKILEIDGGVYKIVLPLIFNDIQINYQSEFNDNKKHNGLITANIKNLEVNIVVNFNTQNVPNIYFNQHIVDTIRNLDITIEGYSEEPENKCLKKAMRKFFEFVIREKVMGRFLSSVQDGMNYHLLFRV